MLGFVFGFLIGITTGGLLVIRAVKKGRDRNWRLSTTYIRHG